MKTSLTSIFGICGAIAYAAAQVPGLPTDVVLGLKVVVAVCVALLGYHSADKFPRPPLPPMIVLAFLLVGIALLSSGCRVGGFAFKAASPTYGSVGIAIGNGAIGNSAVAQTNYTVHAP